MTCKVQPVTIGGQTAAIGRIVHYVSKIGIHAESPAVITMTLGDFDEGAEIADRMRLNVGHVHLLVHGAMNDYRELNIPYSEDVAPGTWHWPSR